MIIYSDYITYFENIAATHKDIMHGVQGKRFFRTTIEELIGAIGNRTIGYPALMLLPLDIRKVGEEDNRYERSQGGFMILDALKSPEDNERKEQILNVTREICEDIIMKIKKDVDECEPLASKIFVEFDINQVRAREWGPVWDNAFGWSYEFPLMAQYTKTYNPEKWQT